jgi:hypothetical protein
MVWVSVWVWAEVWLNYARRDKRQQENKMNEKDIDRQAFRNRFGDRPNPELAFPHELPYWDGAADGFVAGLDHARKQKEPNRNSRKAELIAEIQRLREEVRTLKEGA